MPVLVSTATEVALAMAPALAWATPEQATRRTKQPTWERPGDHSCGCSAVGAPVPASQFIHTSATLRASR